MVSYYTILEVDEHATDEEIKRSYHRLALRYHPDKAGPEGATKFKEINTAYQVLSDPQKKAVYDKYGDIGLDAMDNPMETVIPLEAMNSVVIVLLVLFLVTSIMILIFLSFLGAYVDGHLSSSWNYVKVFSPLFVSDVLMGLPALVLTIATPLLLRGTVGVVLSMACLVALCSVLLTILIPICKDKNEKRMAAGRTDFLKWRVWLIPGYLLSLFAFVLVVLCSFPSSRKRQKCAVYGLHHLARFLPVSFVLRVLAVWCIPIFFALIGCRADEVITTNYFVIIGVPAFVAAFCLVIDFIVCRVLLQVLTRVPEDGVKGNAQAEAMGASGSANERSGREDGADAAANTRFSTPEAHARDEAQPNNSNTGATNTANNNSNNNNNNSGTAEPKPTVIVATHSCCRLAIQILGFLLFIGLLLASVAMIAVRLNYHYAHATYAGVLSLGKAMIPIYMIAGVMVLFFLIMLPLVCCMGPAAFAEPSEEQEMAEEGAAAAHPNQPEQAATGASSPPAGAAHDEAGQPDQPVLLLHDAPPGENNTEASGAKESKTKAAPQTENVDHID